MVVVVSVAVVVVVAVAVPDPAAVNDHAMIQQRAVALGNRLQSLQEVGQLLDMVAVDAADELGALPAEHRARDQLQRAV